MKRTTDAFLNQLVGERIMEWRITSEGWARGKRIIMPREQWDPVNNSHQVRKAWKRLAKKGWRCSYSGLFQRWDATIETNEGRKVTASAGTPARATVLAMLLAVGENVETWVSRELEF